MPKLKLNRYLQQECLCAVSAATSVVNYYFKDVQYNDVKTAAYKIRKDVEVEGMFDSEIGKLFNLFGFKVEIISADIGYLDFSWDSLTKKALIKNLQFKAKELPKKDTDYIVCSKMIEFLKKYGNKLTIDYNFKDRICNCIDSCMPLVACFNWNVFFKVSKSDKYGNIDPINGESEEHAVAINGYDKKGVFVVDSNYEYGKGKYQKYSNGKYKITWEDFLFILYGTGSLVIPRLA
ncbi:MAG: hypothetical protein WDA06_01365 [Phenylobacterium sp.]